MLQVYHLSFDIPYVVFRICVPYGSVMQSAFSYGTIGFFLKMAQAGKDITLYGDGSQKRTFSHIQDICDQVIGVGQLPEVRADIFNIGGANHSLREIGELIAAKYGVRVVFRPWPDADLRLESGSTVFDDTKIQGVMRHEQSTTVDGWVSAVPKGGPNELIR
jgi:UDP-glucose 4-epimerase